MSLRVGPRARLDLHMHSTRSDGALPPDQLLARCAHKGLDYVAITDHDSAPVLDAGIHHLAGRQIYLIHATELSAVYEGYELHLLVYFPGPMPESFRRFLRSRVQERAERYDCALERLQLEGVDPACEEARAGERAMTRQHLAQALVRAGHVPDTNAAFRHLIGNHTGNVPQVTLGWEEAIGLARAAGGLCSWAHPPMSLVEKWSGVFAEMGLSALETRRPGLGRHGRARLERIAHKHGLMVTGGSDWHGLPGQNLGQFCFPGKEARPVLQALGLSS